MTDEAFCIFAFLPLHSISAVTLRSSAYPFTPYEMSRRWCMSAAECGRLLHVNVHLCFLMPAQTRYAKPRRTPLDISITFAITHIYG